MKYRVSGVDGFTLFELLIVVMIIAAMVTIAIPYATRSNEGLKMERECLNIAEAIKYAINLAVDTKRPTRIAINTKDNSFVLEAATAINTQDYEPVEGFEGARRYFSKSISVVDVTGFNIEGDDWYLLFDPTRLWPDASISLSTNYAIKKIKIRGKQVEIEDSTT